MVPLQAGCKAYRGAGRRYSVALYLDSRYINNCLTAHGSVDRERSDGIYMEALITGSVPVTWDSSDPKYSDRNYISNELSEIATTSCSSVDIRVFQLVPVFCNSSWIKFSK